MKKTITQPHHGILLCIRHAPDIWTLSKDIVASTIKKGILERNYVQKFGEFSTSCFFRREREEMK